MGVDIEHPDIEIVDDRTLENLSNNKGEKEEG